MKIPDVLMLGVRSVIFTLQRRTLSIGCWYTESLWKWLTCCPQAVQLTLEHLISWRCSSGQKTETQIKQKKKRKEEIETTHLDQCLTRTPPLTLFFDFAPSFVTELWAFELIFSFIVDGFWLHYNYICTQPGRTAVSKHACLQQDIGHIHVRALTFGDLFHINRAIGGIISDGILLTFICRLGLVYSCMLGYNRRFPAIKGEYEKQNLNAALQS